VRTRAVAAYMVAGVCGFTAAFGITYSAWPTGAYRGLGGRESSTPSQASSEAADSTRLHLVVVYVGAASCGWSNLPEVSELVRAVADSVRARARAKGAQFVAIGVALDWNVSDGIKHLARTAAFDQVASGGNWGNELASRYHSLVRDLPSTPQVLVLERTIAEPRHAVGRFLPEIRVERILFRVSGVVELKRWVRNGVPLPRPS
jgi:hypothetical protein